MTAWQQECFEGYAHSHVLAVANAGPLLSPISTFAITRNDKLELILETLVMGSPQKSSAPVYPDGTVRLTTETVEFAGHGGMTCLAHGVLPFSENKTWNAEHVEQTTQRAKVYALTARTRNDLTPTYTIDWLENLATASSVWTGSFIKDKRETTETRTLGHGAGELELSQHDITHQSMISSALEMVINEVRLYLCVSGAEVSKGLNRPGYIFYVGTPDDATRKKIREVLSFCLGNYLVYLGSTTLDGKSEVISFSAVSPPSIGRIFDISVLPPAPLGDRYHQEVDQRAVARMANAVYAHYEELQFGSFSWTYWHAMCAPVHMAAAHFGAAIEALQRAYMKAHPAKFDKTLIADRTKWTSLKSAFLKAIAEAALEPAISTILTNKVSSNLNQTPQGVLSEKLLAAIGITLGAVETAAWKRRHVAAHGGEVNQDSVVATIRETKLLKIILHRMVLKITGAGDHYHDDYTIGHAIRKVIDPVPSPPPPSGAAPPITRDLP